MKSTSIGIQFDVMDLDAKYEVIGTSDNYSFQYDLGRGDSLVDFEGETAQKTISLKGNYGFFNVRIFAVSDIGIRSAFIETGIAINSPDYNGTFSFSDISVSNLPSSARVGSEIEIEPNGTGILAVKSEYVGRDIDLEWSLLPPNGHAKEGEPLNTELLSDTLFQDFSLSLFDENGGIITDSELNSSEPLQDYLGTANVSDAMNSYRGFSFQISDEILTDLNLGRTFGIEVVSNDSYGRTSTGVLTGINYMPEIDTFSYDLRGSKFFMGWDSLDTDSSTMSIYSLELPEENYIKYPRDIIRSANYYDSLFRAPAWTKQNYSAGDKVIFGDNVYECIIGYNHLDNPDRNPRDQDYWSGCGPVIPHSFLKDDSKPKEFVADQTWGQNYYYAFVPNDEFGPGQTFNLTEDGLIESGELNSDLTPFKSNVKIDNLSFREREDDFVFKWNITDQDGNLVDLNTYKFLVGNTDTPSVLGISGSLFDTDSRSFLTGITEGMNSRTSVTVDGVQSVVENLPSATVFDSYEYTRDLNNEIYGSEDFPEASNFDGTLDYNVGDNVIFLGGELHTSLIESPQGNNIRPGYFTWNNSKDYIYNQPFSSGEEGEFISDGHFFYLCINDSHDWRKFPVTPVTRAAAVAGSLDYDDRYFYICEGGTQWAKFPVATTEARDPAVLNDIYTDPFINLYSEDHFLYVNYQDEWFRAPMIEVDAGDSFSDRAMYDGGVYIATGIDNGTVGPGSESVLGVYNEYLDYSSGSLVISPDRLDIELFSNQIDYNKGELVLFSGTIYRCESETLSGNLTPPSSRVSNWVPDGAFVNLDANIYKATEQVFGDKGDGAENTEVPSSNSVMWELQTPSNSNYFELLIPGYGLSITDYSADNTYLPGDLVVYENNIWSGAKENGVGISAGVQYPSMTNREYWASGPEHLNYRGVWDESTYYYPQDVVFKNIVYEGFPQLSPGPKFYKATQHVSPGFSPGGSPMWAEEPTTDFSTNHQIGDIVISNDTVYKCLANNPTGAPISAIKGNPELINSDYVSSQWQPFWERNPSYEGIIFGHIGIPESGKRSIGLELGILDLNGDVLNLRKIEAFNPEPSITRNSFQVDSTSRTAQTTFNFNYANASREQVTRVQLYRSNVPSFQITGADRLPGTGAESFVSEIVGPGDATFGENITSITDSPPIPNTPGVGEEPTGYFYKILPFDAFGSGDLFDVNRDGDPTIIYPINWSNQNPNGYNGPIYSATEDYIPGTPINFEVDGAFKNYFLSWNAPDSQFLDSANQIIDVTPQDISYYEVWESSEPYLKFGAENRFLEIEENSSGYRRITADTASVGPIPRALQDDASGITNAVNVMTIDAISPKIQASHPGETNETGYFWVRAVDSAGNKSPFTGKANSDPSSAQGNMVEGFEFTLGQAESTDIADFERSITESFPNVLALAPNNPFYNDVGGVVGWSRHLLFSNGVGYVVGAGNASHTQKYIYAGLSDPNEFSDPISYDMSGVLGLIDSDGKPEFPRRNILYSGNYEVSEYHPAGTGEPGTNGYQPPLIDDGDFIIARNDNGNAVPMWHAFANATIGSAHIADAAISNAKINSLSADKIRAGNIVGQDVEIGGTGQIRSAGFGGMSDTGEGFAISGDGSFVFSAGQSKGKMYFDDDGLTIEGNIRQVDGNPFINGDVFTDGQDYFKYDEDQNGNYAIDANQEVTVVLQLKNASSITSASQIRFQVAAKSSAISDTWWASAHVPYHNSTTPFPYWYRIDNSPGSTIFKYAGIKSTSFDSGTKTVKITFAGSSLVGGHWIGFDQLMRVPQNSHIPYVLASPDTRTFIRSYLHVFIRTEVPGMQSSNYPIFNKVIPMIVDGAAGGNGQSGAPGENAYTVIVSNESHLFPSDEAGTVPTAAQDDGDAELIVYEGTQKIDGYITLSNPGNSNGFSVDTSAFNFSPTTANPVSYEIFIKKSGGTKKKWGGQAVDGLGPFEQIWIRVKHSTWATDSAQLEFDVNLKGSSVAATKVYSISKSKQGYSGASPVYRGKWQSGASISYQGYNPTVNADRRGDIVYWDGGTVTTGYYMATQDINPSSAANSPAQGTSFWKSFGPNFQSVATELLLAGNATITNSLVLGTSHPAGTYPGVGTNGRLVHANWVNNDRWNSSGVHKSDDSLYNSWMSSQYNTAGFCLETKYISGNEEAFLDIGGTRSLQMSGSGTTSVDSFIRFDSKSGMLKMNGSIIDNSLEDIRINTQDLITALAYDYDNEGIKFIGSGVNNKIEEPASPTGATRSIGSGIVSGANNKIKGRFSFIGSGYQNICKDNFSVIAGGHSNIMSKDDLSNEGCNFISAGQFNNIHGGSNQSILGGSHNKISYTSDALIIDPDGISFTSMSLFGSSGSLYGVNNKPSLKISSGHEVSWVENVGFPGMISSGGLTSGARDEILLPAGTTTDASIWTKSFWFKGRGDNSEDYDGDWDRNRVYQAETVVRYPAHLNYWLKAKKNVPAGININASDYWEPGASAPTSAQVQTSSNSGLGWIYQQNFGWLYVQPAEHWNTFNAKGGIWFWCDGATNLLYSNNQPSGFNLSSPPAGICSSRWFYWNWMPMVRAIPAHKNEGTAVQGTPSPTFNAGTDLKAGFSASKFRGTYSTDPHSIPLVVINGALERFELTTNANSSGLGVIFNRIT